MKVNVKLTEEQCQAVYAALCHYLEDSSLGESEDFDAWEENCTEIHPIINLFKGGENDAT